MEIVTKQATAAVAPVDGEHPNGSFEVILSTESLDRDKEHLWANEWKQPLPEKIHFDGDHGRSLDKTVGSAVPHFEGNKLVAKGTFAGTPYAQMVRQLVNEGHVNSVSVTFSESKNEKGEGVQRELLNAAFVAIPANPEAVVLASKSAKASAQQLGTVPLNGVAQSVGLDGSVFDKAEGGLSASGDNPQVPKHDAMVQAIHDAAIHLGAQCLNDITADPGTADGANKSALNVHKKWHELPDGTFAPIEKSSSPEEVGSPQESADESAAAAKAAAADESADDAAHQKAKELEKARGLAFLISMNTKD